MNPHFPVLSRISAILRVAGWVLVVAGSAYGVLEGLLEPIQPGHVFATQDAVQLGIGFLAAMCGLLTAALGESIGVLFAIEENTRRAAEGVRDRRP